MGSLLADRVQLWLAREDGELLATMWPGEYRARLEPLVVIDDEGRVVARGGAPAREWWLPPFGRLANSRLQRSVRREPDSARLMSTRSTRLVPLTASAL
jgi:hypothetical protein